MSELIRKLKKAGYTARRNMGLTPIYKVFNEIKRHNINPKSLRALDVFGGYGDQTSKDYYPMVKSLEVWELLPECENDLRKNLPGAKIRILDSFSELKKTKDKFNFVFIDNPTPTYDGHCEHFDMFPGVFNLLEDESFILTNIITNIYSRKRDETSLNQRKKFYDVDDAFSIGIDKMINVYKRLANENGFELEWYYTKDRYLLRSIKKRQLRFHFLLMRFLKKR